MDFMSAPNSTEDPSALYQAMGAAARVRSDTSSYEEPSGDAQAISAVVDLGRRYLEEAVMTATPAARLVMLFDRLVMDLEVAEVGFKVSDWFQVSSALVHAQEILAVLHMTLDQGVWQGAERLGVLYQIWQSELMHANLDKDRDRMARTAAMISKTAGAWRAASLACSKEAYAHEPGRIAANG